jgi:hypothetical protein
VLTSRLPAQRGCTQQGPTNASPDIFARYATTGVERREACTEAYRMVDLAACIESILRC